MCAVQFGRNSALLLLAALLAGGCLARETEAQGPVLESVRPAAAPQSGTVRLLSYNVAGLPEGISPSNPSRNIPQISPLLNGYDLALIQEDFVFHEELARDVQHPHRSRPGKYTNPFDVGDGLNRFSAYPIYAHRREAWSTCHGYLTQGADCLASKGFSVATHEIAPGVLLDVYDLHMDAGNSPEDRAARRRQTEQLLTAIETRSRHRAIVVAGDFNMKRADEATFQRLLREAGLACACRATGCEERYRIDKVLFRSAPNLAITPKNVRFEEHFVDARGERLSDHQALAVDLAWEYLPLEATEVIAAVP